MRLIDLPREFVYTDRKSLNEFIRESELNNLLYKVYLDVKDTPSHFNFNAVEVFNQVYYIATLAMNERNPEQDVEKWWHKADFLDYENVAGLVMSMVYTLLYLQKNKTESIKNVLNLMEGNDFGEDYYPYFSAMARREGPKFNSDFSIRPWPVDKIVSSSGWWSNSIRIDWAAFSDGYEQSSIRDLVSLFSTNEDRLKVIDLIEKSQLHIVEDEIPF